MGLGKDAGPFLCVRRGLRRSTRARKIGIADAPLRLLLRLQARRAIACARRRHRIAQRLVGIRQAAMELWFVGQHADRATVVDDRFGRDTGFGARLLLEWLGRDDPLVGVGK